MSIELVTSNIWQLITKTVKAHPSKSMVAVAYFGQQAAAMLPLKKGSILLVDASEKAVKSGQTCPEELLKLYYKGVEVYSLANLHAKIYVTGRTLLIGSANVSGNSSKFLQEAIIKTNDKQAVEDAKAFIESHCHIDMGEEQLLRLQKLYRPPKFNGVKSKNSKNNKSAGSKQPSFFVYNLAVGEWSDEENQQAEKGRKEAKNHRINMSRHMLDEFKWVGNFVAKKGDTVMQITHDNNQVYVSPPGTLIHIRKWNNGKQITNFCYVEVSNKRRKNINYLKKHFKLKTFKLISRNGRKNKEVATDLINLW